MQKYATIEKQVGETPLEAATRLRKKLALPIEVPLAYAGRLDPMASGTLLILIGDECKKQEQYHALDKEYIFEVLLGASSDTGDVLGLITPHDINDISHHEIEKLIKSLTGPIELPYPRFSSKTVRGKPLHEWTLRGGLDDSEIPTQKSLIYVIELLKIEHRPVASLLKAIREKIETIPPVTDPKKSLGRDFRRTDVRASWDAFETCVHRTELPVLTLRCVCSSGTYMRSLAGLIGDRQHTGALALSIHRTRIGKVWFKLGSHVFWRRLFKNS